jgi:CheY-like chemotaxis protein
VILTAFSLKTSQIPFTIGEKVHSMRRREIVGRSCVQKRGRVVLVVGSDGLAREARSLLLACSGWRVMTAATARQAMETASKEQPDVALLDLVLPDMDGFEACRLLRCNAGTEAMPVLLLGAPPQPAAEERVTLAGAAGFVPETEVSSELVSCLRQVVLQMDDEKAVDAATCLCRYRSFLSRVGELVSNNRPFGLLLVKLVGLRAVTWETRDAAVRLATMAVREVLALAGERSDVASYRRSGDFLVLTGPYRASALCRRVLARFESLSGSYLSVQATLSLAIGGVTNLHRGFANTAEVIRLAEQAARYARRRGLGHYLASWERRLMTEDVPLSAGLPFAASGFEYER